MSRWVSGLVIGLLAAAISPFAFAQDQSAPQTTTTRSAQTVSPQSPLTQAQVPATNPQAAPTGAPAVSAASQSATNPATNQAASAGMQGDLVLELASNQWFEGPLERIAVSGDGNWALVRRRDTQANLQLYSLKTGQADRLSLIADLNRVDNASFCGRWDSLGTGGLARLGERITEDGWFLPHDDAEELSSVPADAVPVCAANASEVAYYRPDAPQQSIFIDMNGNVRNYGVSGHVTAITFSPDGNYVYGLLFLANGQSVLIRIDANTGQSRIMASHLDSSPLPEHISVSPDGKKLYVALASEGAPNNVARQNPEADRWLKVYSLDLSTGVRQDLVDTPGEDNDEPTVARRNLYWVHTQYNDSIALVPSIGGQAKQVVAEGELPMWSPDSQRIGYFYGGARLADWGLDLDDAVVSIDGQGNRASDPAVIVSGYGEDFSPAWSPDGKWIAFHSHRSMVPTPQYGDSNSTDDVYLRRADDVHAPEIRLTDFGWETGPAYWSPDGKKLLFTSWDRNGQAGIDKLWVLTLDPGTGNALDATMLPLGPQIRSVSWAAWSPDGTQIAIEDNRGGQDRTLWVVRSDGSQPQKVVDYKGTTYDGLDWMADGVTIVYSALVDGRLQLFVIPRIGGVPHQLTFDSGNLMHPKVSPDGKWIACTRIVQSKQIWRRKLQ